MYKLLLSWRYLRTRYIALASIISVTLGVGTLIVVNSVMAGFTHEMHVRLHGILSDVIVEAHSMDGLVDPAWHMAEIRKAVGEEVVGMTAAVHVPAMLTMTVRGQVSTRQITLIGVDEATYANVSDFRQYLLHRDNQKQLSFKLREDGYGDAEHELPPSGWKYRRMKVAYDREFEAHRKLLESQSQAPQTEQAASVPADPTGVPLDPNSSETAAATFDPSREQFTGIVLGIAIGSVRQRSPEGKVMDYFLCRPGDDVQVTFPSAGTPPKAISDQFTVVDYYESKMSEYDSGFAFMPLTKLQQMRGMIDPQSGIGAVTTIQLKLKPGSDLNLVRDKLRAHFPIEKFPYRIQTSRDMQGPLLAAVQMETTLLNILLFLIIAVAGFGILATFFMIVVEKTRDIGILKALGAPSRGVMSIFLNYGFSLGIVGSGAGMLGGLLFVAYINDVARLIEVVTGQEVFDPTVYYFERIPTDVEPLAVAGVVLGAVLIAVLASVLPALRAARMHPVERFAMSSTLVDRQSKVEFITQTAELPRVLSSALRAPRSALLSAIGLKKSYRKGQLAVPVLKGVDFQVESGGFTAVVGQSGCGKSTLLHLLGTLDAPDAGEIHFAGRRIDNLAARSRDALRNEQFGMIFQFYHLLPELSTLENVLAPIMIRFGFLRYWRERPQHIARAKELLEMVGLGHRLTHKPRELSGGEMQRAAIARALISQPKLLLADEPTGNLDQKTGGEILSLLKTLNREQGLTIVMVTHDQAIARQADHTVRLVEGQVAADSNGS